MSKKLSKKKVKQLVKLGQAAIQKNLDEIYKKVFLKQDLGREIKNDTKSMDNKRQE